MTINAAMPAVTPTTSYTGTAAAPDMANGTASDFGGTLDNMMNAKETAAVDVAATQSEVDAQMTTAENGEQIAVLTEQTELLHKELMMKNAGYAQSELIAMLLNGANAELTEIMSFTGEATQAVEEIIAEVQVADLQLPTESEFIPAVQGEAEAVMQTAEAEGEEFDFVQAVNPEKAQTETEVKVEQDVQLQQDVQHKEIAWQPEVAETLQKAPVEKIAAEAEKTAATVIESADDFVDTDEAVITEKPQMMTQSAEKAETNDNGQITVKTQTKDEVEVIEQSFTAEEPTEETVEFDRTFAQAGKKISEKSEEALQLAKSISKTKSDSDLEAEKKVTVKQELSDAGVMKNDVRFERTETADSAGDAPVKLTVNETYQLISERASATTGKQTFTVVLTPETLGKITVKMTSESGKLSVEILTETDAAKQLFETRANELANNLRQSNVEIESYKVETENNQFFNESFDGSSKNPYRESHESETPEEDDEFERLISEMMGM